jgi:hypothetical protein
MLVGGEPVPHKSRQMGADDISKRTLDRAKKKLRVESERSDTSKGRHPLHSWATFILNKLFLTRYPSSECNVATLQS